MPLCFPGGSAILHGGFRSPIASRYYRGSKFRYWQCHEAAQLRLFTQHAQCWSYVGQNEPL